MTKMNKFDWVAIVLLLIGGLNWGLVGVLNFNLVQWIFGTGLMAKAVYTTVGAATLYSIYSLMKL